MLISANMWPVRGAASICLLVGCESQVSQATKLEERNIERVQFAIRRVMDTPREVEFPEERFFVRKIARPTGYAVPGDETQQFDCLITGVADVETRFGVMERIHWWVVRRLHEHGGFTNERWGLSSVLFSLITRLLPAA